MAIITDLDALIADGVITETQARLMRIRSREAMVRMLVNLLMTAGVLLAVIGMGTWLDDMTATGAVGAVLMALGLGVLLRADAVWRLFGIAATLIGAIALLGSGIELMMTHLAPRTQAITVMALGLVLMGLGALWREVPVALRFVTRALLIAGAGANLAGLQMLVSLGDLPGWQTRAVLGYVTLLLLGTGIRADLRGISLLAIIPWALMPHVGDSHDLELLTLFDRGPSITIVQMALTMLVCALAIRHGSHQRARHAASFAVAAFVLLNIGFMLGAIAGETLGDVRATGQLPGVYAIDPDTRQLIGRSWFEQAWDITPAVFSIVWALVLAGCAWIGASRLERGLFNTAIFFGICNGLIQIERYWHDDPLIWMLTGLTAIPLAWAIWRLNRHFG